MRREVEVDDVLEREPPVTVVRRLVPALEVEVVLGDRRQLGHRADARAVVRRDDLLDAAQAQPGRGRDVSELVVPAGGDDGLIPRVLRPLQARGRRLHVLQVVRLQLLLELAVPREDSHAPEVHKGEDSLQP